MRLSCGHTGCSRCIKAATIASATDILGLRKPRLLPGGGRAFSLGGAGQEVQPTNDSTGARMPCYPDHVPSIAFVIRTLLGCLL